MRDITLSAGAKEDYWVYFIPQPTDHGLPQSPADLQKVLKVYLSTRPDANGRTKQLMRLPLAIPMLNNLDLSYGEGFGAHARGTKLIVCVSEGSSQPLWQEYQHAVGTTEDPAMVRVGVADLPENVLGYDAVDAILWLSAKADKLEEAGSRRKEAIDQFIRNGGQLVVWRLPNRTTWTRSRTCFRSIPPASPWSLTRRFSRFRNSPARASSTGTGKSQCGDTGIGWRQHTSSNSREPHRLTRRLYKTGSTGPTGPRIKLPGSPAAESGSAR